MQAFISLNICSIVVVSSLFPSVEGLIIHSDQGWQYQHAYYRNTLKEHGIIQSMFRKENCYDNCIMETFFGRLKNGMYYDYKKDYHSFEAFSKAVEELQIIIIKEF